VDFFSTQLAVRCSNVENAMFVLHVEFLFTNRLTLIKATGT
jgi:hypothetical protein